MKEIIPVAILILILLGFYVIGRLVQYLSHRRAEKKQVEWNRTHPLTVKLLKELNEAVAYCRQCEQPLRAVQSKIDALRTEMNYYTSQDIKKLQLEEKLKTLQTEYARLKPMYEEAVSKKEAAVFAYREAVNQET